MATKVEELHDKIFGTHKTIISGTGAGSSFGHYPQMPTEEEFDAAIAAAEARSVQRGRAEGAEQERGRILSGASHLARNMDARESEFFVGEIVNDELDAMITRKDCYIVPASVLAPKEEK